jgi:hypothetical protein
MRKILPLSIKIKPDFLHPFIGKTNHGGINNGNTTKKRMVFNKPTGHFTVPVLCHGTVGLLRALEPVG